MNKPFVFCLFLGLAGSIALAGGPKPKPVLNLSCSPNCALGQSFTVSGINFDPDKSYFIYGSGCGNPIQYQTVDPAPDGSFETLPTSISCAADWTFEIFVLNRNGSPTRRADSVTETFQ